MSGALWQMLRYALIAGGSFIAARGGFSENEIESIAGAIVTLLTFAWGLWVKWKTVAVPKEIAHDLPQVNPATGVVAQPDSRDVAWLQQSLNAVMGTDLRADGVYDSRTTAVVRQFQTRYMKAKDADGWCGPNTMIALWHQLEQKEKADGPGHRA